MVYLCSAYWDPEAERALAHDDPEVGIDWPLEELAPSARDAQAPRLAQLREQLESG